MNALSEKRRAAGWTAMQLAKAAGTFEPRIYAFERDRFSPHFDEALRIANALGVPVAELFPRVIQRRTMARRVGGRSAL